MRSLLFRTFLVAFILSVIAVATSTIIFTKTLTPRQASEVGTTNGFSGSETPQILEGAKVLWLLVTKDPSFGARILLPQFGLYLVFLWSATLIGSTSRIRASRA
jgi:hypothetical protein